MAQNIPDGIDALACCNSMADDIESGHIVPVIMLGTLVIYMRGSIGLPKCSHCGASLVDKHFHKDVFIKSFRT